MPPELPGFYFDHEKNRYFPLSSKPPPKPVPVTPPKPSQTRFTRDASNLEVLRTAPTTGRTCRRALNQAMLQTLSRSTLLKTKMSPPGALISALCVTERRQYIGDNTGSVYFTHDQDEEDGWHTFWHLLERGISDIVSISAVKSRVVVVCSGSTCRIVVAPEEFGSHHADEEVGFELRPNPSMLRDVWASTFNGSSLSLGSHNKVVHMDDITDNRTLRSLPTPSDVLCLDSSASLVYAGMRNGGVFRFDTRDYTPAQPLFQSDQRTTITNLKSVRNWQMVIVQINGRIGSYDLRYLKSEEPVLMFEGHSNSVRQKLGFAVDPAHNFVFLAGDDNRLRAWSLSNGEQCLASGSTNGDDLFQRVFPGPIIGMEVSQVGSAEPLLYLTTREALFRYRIGNVSL